MRIVDASGNELPVGDIPARSIYVAVKFVDTLGAATGYKTADGKPRVSCTPYTYDVAEGNLTGHEVFHRIAYTPTINTTESEVWSKAGKYVFPTAEQAMEVVSSDNTQDIGTAIFSGTSTGGTTTSLIDTGKDFTAGTAVAVGDCVILDKSGASPEFGYVTGVATTTLTVAGGFSAGGSGDTRAYTVIDKSAYTGAQAVEFEYLDSSYVEHTEIVILNGTSAVATVNSDIFRINNMHLIATGSLNESLGNISLRGTGAGATYAYITATFTQSRSSIYTVPTGKTLFITLLTFGFGAPNDTKFQSARLNFRANFVRHNNFHTGNLFFPFREVQCTNAEVVFPLAVPIVIPAQTDLKSSAIAATGGSGPGTFSMDGWLE